MIRMFISALLMLFVVYGLWSTFEEDVPTSALQAIEPMTAEVKVQLSPVVDSAQDATSTAIKMVSGATTEARSTIRKVQSAGAATLDGDQAVGAAGIDWYKEGGE